MVPQCAIKYLHKQTMYEHFPNAQQDIIKTTPNQHNYILQRLSVYVFSALQLSSASIAITLPKCLC